MASAIEVSTGHTHSNTSNVNRHPQKSNNTIKPRRKQLMCQTIRLAQEMTRRKLWIKLNVRLERAKVWRLANPRVDQEMTAQSTYTTKQKISSIKRRDQRDHGPSSERDTKKSKFQSQRRKAGTTQLIFKMHKINKEAKPLKRYKLKIKQHEVHKINTKVEPPNSTNQTEDQAALGNQTAPRIYSNDAFTELHTQEVAAKWHIMQALQQHYEIKLSKPETHQSIGWRNQHKSRKRGHQNTASRYFQPRLCLQISTSPLQDRLSSTGTQHQQSTTSNETMAGMEKIYISASTYLHETTNTHAAQLSQP